MKERPIIFNGAMVRAILAGTKTQTRRIVKPQPLDGQPELAAHLARRGHFEWFTTAREGTSWRCPYGVPGDRLWVRETWRYADWTEDGDPWIRYKADEDVRLVDSVSEEWSERLTEIWAGLSVGENFNIDNRAADRRWRSARFMPRWASRLTLEITDVRAQRLQEISEEDARAEGAPQCSRRVVGFDEGCPSYVCGFKQIWSSINAKRAPWASNPWVWAISFRCDHLRGIQKT